jgi:hypothetical protein
MSESFLNAPLIVHVVVAVMGVLSVGAVVGIPLWWIASTRRVMRDLRAFAAATDGVSLVQPRTTLLGRHRFPKVVGQLGGVPVEVNVYAGGEHSRDHVIYSATCLSRLPDGLELRPPGLESMLGQMFGTQDILVGDPAFDAAFVVRGTDPSTVQSFLADPRLRWELQRGMTSDIHLSVGVFTCRVEGHQTDLATMQHYLSRVVALARTVDQARPWAAPAGFSSPPGTDKWRAGAKLPKWVSALYVIGALLSPAIFVGFMHVPYVVIPLIGAAGYLIHRSWPSPPTIEITRDALIIETPEARSELPLRHLIHAYGPWLIPHSPLPGTVLYLQCGERRWTIGGYGYRAPSHRVPPAAEADLVLAERAFGELTHRLHQGLSASRGMSP